MEAASVSERTDEEKEVSLRSHEDTEEASEF